MSFFEKNDNNQHTTQKFLDEFSEKVNDKAQSIELANLIADKACLEKLDLMQWFGRDAGLWGLIVFCTNQNYFYIHATENRMFGFTRNSENSTFPEQLISFSKLPSFSAQVKPHTFWSFLDTDQKHTLNCSFKDEAAVMHTFSLRTQHTAESVLSKLKSV